MTTPAQITAVNKDLVHKNNPGEVLLTGSRNTRPDTFVVTARWPDRHSFYAAVDGYDDPLLAAEAVRQAIPFLCHTAYDVPFGHRQIWSRFSYSFCPGALASHGSSELELHISCLDIIRRTDRLSGMSLQVDLVRNGIHLGTASAGFTNQSGAIYRRLRGSRADVRRAVARSLPLAPPVPPRQVSRRRTADVVLSPTHIPGRFGLRVDTTHPVLFDHPVDHVPGMLLLEGARQAAHSRVGSGHVATDMKAVFSQYAELDSPCWVETSAVDRRSDHVVVSTLIHQNNREVFAADVTMLRVRPQ